MRECHSNGSAVSQRIRPLALGGLKQKKFSKNDNLFVRKHLVLRSQCENAFGQIRFHELNCSPQGRSECEILTNSVPKYADMLLGIVREKEPYNPHTPCLLARRNSGLCCGHSPGLKHVKEHVS